MGWLDYMKANEMDKAETLMAGMLKYTPDYSFGLATLANGDNVQASNGHFSDAGKLPNHPTFSNEAVLSQKGMMGGNWDTDRLGATSYTPSLDQVLGRNPQLSTKGLASYMKFREPDVQLKAPIPVDPAYFSKVTR